MASVKSGKEHTGGSSRGRGGDIMASQLLVLLLQSLQSSDTSIDVSLGGLRSLEVADSVALGCDLGEQLGLSRVSGRCSGGRCRDRC
jgi:hypothetical protein